VCACQEQVTIWWRVSCSGQWCHCTSDAPLTSLPLQWVVATCTVCTESPAQLRWAVSTQLFVCRVVCSVSSVQTDLKR
jgi:hypothetical protein